MAIKRVGKLDPKIKLLRNEIDIIRSLSHPNVCAFIEAREDEESLHLVMEYVKGANLLKVLLRSRLPEWNVRYLFR